METSLLKKINGLADDHLREGGEIIVGWYIPANQETSKKEQDVAVNKKTDKTVARPQEPTSVEPEEDTKEREEEPVLIMRKRVIGYWDKNNSSKKGLFVLSDLARPGTKMELYYQMNRTKVMATVIGRIPPATYPEETEIFISPEVAEKLGIFDTRFSVVTKFVAVDEER